MLWATATAIAQDTAPPTATPLAADQLAGLSAQQAVRRGNHHLLEGKPKAALNAYRQAEKKVPDAREVAFVEGLAHYDLNQFDLARTAFEKATGVESDSLAVDAQYSLGACDHAEAIRTQADLQRADPLRSLRLLESAMRRYQSVLANRPNHKTARDANFKAANLWRQLKRQMQQQQQQQQPGDQDQEDGGEKDKQQSQEEQNSSQDQDKKQQDQQESKQQDQNQDQDSQQQQPAENQDEQQQEALPKPAEQQVSREQAQRKLREMMQALRDRKKARRKVVQPVPVRALEKDW